MPTLPAVSTIAQTIQLSMAPVFMLAGIATLLNVLAGRLARVIMVAALAAAAGLALVWWRAERVAAR